MIGIWFCFFTIGAQAQPQASQPAAGTAATPASGRESVGPTQAVITVQGICNADHASAAAPGACVTTMTREQFESLVNAFNPNGQPITDANRQNFARTYAELLALEAAARRSGVEDTPEFRQVMDVLRLRTAADLYRQSLERRFRNPPQDEIAAYYREHVADFERVKLARILIPRRNPASADAQDFERKALDAANSARERAVKGDEPEKIQKDVYAALGLKTTPATELGAYRRSDMIEKESTDVFALRAGEVTAVEVEAASYVIYKVITKETPALDQVKEEIARMISQKKFKEAMQAVTASAPATFNDQYFGPGMKNLPVVSVPLPSHSGK